MSREDKIQQLRYKAMSYYLADNQLEIACGNELDPIACTVFALKKKHLDSIPKESFVAADLLDDVVKIHCDLVTNYGMTADEVRNIWYPILNNGVTDNNCKNYNDSHIDSSVVKSLLGRKGILPQIDGESCVNFEVSYDDEHDKDVVIHSDSGSMTMPREIVEELLC